MASTSEAQSPFRQREEAARQQRAAEFDRLAPEREHWMAKNAAYYRAIERLVAFCVPPGASVLEIGCGTGDLLAALRPSDGVGIDLSSKLIERAREKHPSLQFIVDDAESLDAPELRNRRFDYVVLCDVVGLLPDVWLAFRALRRVCSPHTRVIVTYYNFLWEPVLKLGERFGRKMPFTQQNWLGMQDLANLLELNHFEIVRRSTAQLLPIDFPLLAPMVNRYLSGMPGLRHLALTQLFVAKLAGSGGPIPTREYSCSVVVPCKNEQGNIDEIIARVPDMGKWTEIIFVDGNSDDGTVEAITRHLEAKTRPRLSLTHQGDGKGKGDAVRKGFAAAQGDILFILDADLTVAPEDLLKFYAVLAEGRGEFVNGSRLVYPMEEQAMRFLNSVGNKLFGVALSEILEQPLKDTLCGTKVLFRRDYEKIAQGRGFFGKLDPFGDFDLLFGAAKQNLKIVELPVHYRARTYGDTKISRFQNGAQLLRMTAHAFRKFRSAH
jgi:SAM-dependent methyltransferase